MKIFKKIINKTRNVRRKLSEFVYPESLVVAPIGKLSLDCRIGYDRVKINSRALLPLRTYYMNDDINKEMVLDNLKRNLLLPLIFEMDKEGCVDYNKRIIQERDSVEYMASVVVFKKENNRDEFKPLELLKRYGKS